MAYLSQRLDLLDDDRSVAENLAAAAPSLPLTRRRHLLAQFLFRGDTVDTATGSLSGGERLRATLACVLFAEPAPQLLLLDEPTNNLDLAGVAQLESALAAYRGAFIVVSHDAVFLDRIGVQRWIRLLGGRVAGQEARGAWQGSQRLQKQRSRWQQEPPACDPSARDRADCLRNANDRRWS